MSRSSIPAGGGSIRLRGLGLCAALAAAALVAGRDGAPTPAPPGDAASGGGVEASESAPAPGYRLRIRGLHLPPEGAEARPARVEIGAAAAPGTPSALVVEARLLDEASGRVLWERVYRVEGEGQETLQRAVSRALRDAMERTREGSAGGIRI